jgi:hypothetical protein
MGTAVLSGKMGVSLDKDVWVNQEDSPKKECISLERIAHDLRLDGYDAVVVCDGSDGSKLKKYINPETGRVWQKSEYEKNSKPAVK